MKEELNELRNKELIEFKQWAGFSQTPGTTITIVTRDYQVYLYQKYTRIPIELKDKIKPEKLIKVKDLDKETINSLNNAIEEKIIGKTFENIMMRDAGYYINGEYKSQKFHISNNIELYKEIKEIIK